MNKQMFIFESKRVLIWIQIHCQLSMLVWTEIPKQGILCHFNLVNFAVSSQNNLNLKRLCNKFERITKRSE